MTTIGPLGTGGWGSALGALGGFGGQGLLVLPPLPVPLPVPGGPLLPSPETRCCCPAACARSPFRELPLDHVPQGDVDRGARRVHVGLLVLLNPRRDAGLRRACPAGSTSSSASAGGGTRTLPPAASPPRPAGGRGDVRAGARSSWACRLRTGGGCGGSAGPKPTHAAGVLHGGGAAATSCPLPANSPWQRGRS